MHGSSKPGEVDLPKPNPKIKKKANHKVPGHGFVRTFTGGEVLGGECCGKRVQEIVIMLWNPGKEQS